MERPVVLTASVVPPRAPRYTEREAEQALADAATVVEYARGRLPSP
jgi:hypothetical protein